MNPDSAVGIKTEVRAGYKPGTAKTHKRTVSRSCSELGTRCRFVSGNYSIHRSPAADKGQRPIGFAVEGLCPALYVTSNCGIQDEHNALSGSKAGASRARKPWRYSVLRPGRDNSRLFRRNGWGVSYAVLSPDDVHGERDHRADIAESRRQDQRVSGLGEFTELGQIIVRDP